MNSSVKFFDAIVSVVAAFAALRLDLLGGGGVLARGRGRLGRIARATAARQDEGKQERCCGAGEHAAAIIPRPPDGGRGNAPDYLVKPACWR